MPLVGSRRRARRSDVPTCSARSSRSTSTYTGLCVVGPPRSGRTTALRQVARSLVARATRCGRSGSATIVGGPGRHAAAKVDAAVELLEDFAALCESLPQERPYILVIDNVDRYDNGELSGAYERIAKSENSRLVGSLDIRNLSGYTQNLVLSEIRREPTLLVLNPEIGDRRDAVTPACARSCAPDSRCPPAAASSSTTANRLRIQVAAGSERA